MACARSRRCVFCAPRPSFTSSRLRAHVPAARDALSGLPIFCQIHRGIHYERVRVPWVAPLYGPRSGPRGDRQLRLNRQRRLRPVNQRIDGDAPAAGLPPASVTSQTCIEIHVGCAAAHPPLGAKVTSQPFEPSVTAVAVREHLLRSLLKLDSRSRSSQGPPREGFRLFLTCRLGRLGCKR